MAMKRTEYLKKRGKLLDELDAMVRDGSDNYIFEAKKAEVEELDQAYSEEQLEALMSTPIRMPWQESGETLVVDGPGAGVYHNGIPTKEDPLFLSNVRTMASLAREKDGNAALYNQPGALAAVVRGVVSGRWESPELKNQVTTTSAGVLIPQVLSGQIIDLARAQSLFGAAGVPTVPMDTNNLKIARVTKDPVFAFKAEGAAADESSFEMDSVDLKSHTVYGYAYVSNEALNSAANLDSIIRNVFAAAIAQAIDKAFLFGGEDDAAPEGILNDQDILTYQYVGDTPTYADYIKAAGKVRALNGDPTHVGMCSAFDDALSLATNENGDFLVAPEAFTRMVKLVSNQLSTEDRDDALVFDPSALLIGIQNNVQVKVLTGDEGIKKNMTAFVVSAELDCKVVRPKSICKLVKDEG